MNFAFPFVMSVWVIGIYEHDLESANKWRTPVMIVRELVVKSKTGFHARPATLWIQEASRYQSSIVMKKDENEVDGKSLLGILSLELTPGSRFGLIVEGVDEVEAAKNLENLVDALENQE